MDEDKKYPSKYSNDKLVTPAQYITEIICENKAKKDGTDLHYRFWTNRAWSVFYRNQIASANKLVKQYSDVAIIRALKRPEAAKIYSLRAPHLKPMIESEQEKLLKENRTFNLEPQRPSNVKFGTTQKSKQNIFSKLKDIDNER